jgi:alkanesulfonate monooxygenase SsuD/methylene tetrahydromethanopterin reductase-like flavin-dependent oxidoreductase (luciferase family)
MMTGCIYGAGKAEVEWKVAERTGGKRSVEDLRRHGVVAGTAAQMADQLGQLAEAGVQRVMLQWLYLDDIAGLEGIAKGVLPNFPAQKDLFTAGGAGRGLVGGKPDPAARG